MLAISLFTALEAAAVVTGLSVQPGASEVRFTAVGTPSALKIKGAGAKPSGRLEAEGDNLHGDLTIALADFTTGISLRDRHMKEKYLEVGKADYANAKLSVTKLGRGCVLEAKAEGCPFEGTLALHGKTQPISGLAHAKKDGAAFAVEAAFAIKLADFAIDVPKFAGITVANEVNVEADVSLAP